MRQGQEYERFIYEKFNFFFNEFELIKNDKIIGKISGIKREIDISIKGKVNDINFLYLVSCKDHNRPANITIIGEFSSVIKDVGASKGILVCSSGFAKTIHKYALSLGIELVTIEDINSNRWKAKIEIPIVYINKTLNTSYSAFFKVTKELEEKNREALCLTENDIFKLFSLDNGVSCIKLVDYITSIMESQNININDPKPIKIADPNLLMKIIDVWVPVSFDINFTVINSYYLKYIQPDEYSQLIDHLSKKIQPLNLKLLNFNFELDDSYIKIEENNCPISSIVSIEITENLKPLNELTFEYTNISIPNSIIKKSSL